MTWASSLAASVVSRSACMILMRVGSQNASISAHPLFIAWRQHLMLGRHHGDRIDRSGNLGWHEPS